MKPSDLGPELRQFGSGLLDFFREIIDGIEATGLRARHVRAAYGAAVLLRQFDLFYF